MTDKTDVTRSVDAIQCDRPAQVSANERVNSMKRLGIFGQGWWADASRAGGHEVVDLPTATHDNVNPYAADIGARVRAGREAIDHLQGNAVDMLVDNGGVGLAFVPDDANPDRFKPVHEAIDRVWCSHFVDPIVVALQGISWGEAWQCLQSRTWIKAVWDRAQAIELHKFGVPSVIHMPMAAPDREYDTTPLDPKNVEPVVSFIGGQNTNYFNANVNVPTKQLLPGILAQAAHSDLPQVNFYEAYHDVYGIGTPIQPGDDVQTQIHKTMAYFNAKLFYNACNCIRNRDRFIIFLSRVLGDQFRLIGTGWDEAYGIKAAAPIPSAEAYFDRFRQAAVNINLVNGNSETGLNMRHFEITAAGGFMLCYDQPELAEHFEIGTECDVFRNEQEMLEKIQYYLAHPKERCEIAFAGQQRTLKNHLYSHRLQALFDGITVGPLPVTYSTSNAWTDIKAVASKPKVLLDCGANTGQTATQMRQAFPGAQIFSFEPVSAIFDKLKETCAQIDVTPVKKAVTDRNGRQRMHLTAYHEANSLLDFEEGNPCAKWNQEVGAEEVEVCTLDQWCKDSDVDPTSVGLLKMDVQGAELQALQGATTLLEAGVPVYLEVSFVPIYKNAPLCQDIEGFLTGYGYTRHGIYPSDQPHHWGDALYTKNA